MYVRIDGKQVKELSDMASTVCDQSRKLTKLEAKLQRAMNVIEMAYRERVLGDDSITESEVYDSLACALDEYYGVDTKIEWADGFPETGDLSDFAKKFPNAIPTDVEPK